MTVGEASAETRSLIRRSSVWRMEESPAEVDFTTADSTRGVCWFDLVGEPNATDELLSKLAPLCPGLDGPMLSDLLTPDEQPEGSSYSGGEIRLASSFAVDAYRPRLKVERGSAQGAGVLVFQPVELLAGDGWLLTCWHPTRTFAGARKVSEGEPRATDELFNAVVKQWRESGCSTAGDLGVLIMHELALGYRAAHWALAAWLQDWELSLYVEDDVHNPDELPQLWGAMAVLRDWLNPLNLPGLRSSPEHAWLPAVTKHEQVIAVDDRIDKALRDLRELSDTMRASFGVLQVQLTEDDRMRREESQHRIELIAAILLVPTLVVGFYGANTWVPGEGQHWGFWVMLAAILMLSAGAAAVVVSWRRREKTEAALANKERDRKRAEFLRAL